MTVFENVLPCSSTPRVARRAPLGSVSMPIEFVGLGNVAFCRRSARSVAAERRLVEVARAVVGTASAGAARRAGRRPADEETDAPRRRDQADPRRTGAMVVLVDHDMESGGRHVLAVDRSARLRPAGDRPGADRRSAQRPERDGGLHRHRGGGRVTGRRDRRALGCRAAGRPCLQGCLDHFPLGEITTLLGPNGAGKSTLVLGDRRDVEADGGTIRIGDIDITGAKPDKISGAGVAVVPEGRRLLPRPDGRRQPQGRHLQPVKADERGRHRLRDVSCSPSSRRGFDTSRPIAVGRRAADGRAGPGAGVEAEGDGGRRAVARSGAGRGQAPDARDRAASPTAASACC